MVLKRNSPSSKLRSVLPICADAGVKLWCAEGCVCVCVCARANVLCTFSADRTAHICRRARLDVRSRHCQSRVPFKQTTGATKLRRPLPSYVEGESRRGERERERERENYHITLGISSHCPGRARVCVCVVWSSGLPCRPSYLTQWIIPSHRDGRIVRAQF